MKKYLINDNWDLEAFDDRSDLFLLVIERNLPDCSYVYKYDTDPGALKPAYNQLINQYNDTAVDGPLNICIIKVPNTAQVTNQISSVKTLLIIQITLNMQKNLTRKFQTQKVRGCIMISLTMEKLQMLLKIDLLILLYFFLFRPCYILFV